MNLSKIAIGCDSDPFHNGEGVSPIFEECARLGVNVFDSARGYGKSEETLGNALRGKNREDYFIITKGCLPFPFSRLNPRALSHDLETSLKKLDLGYIDLYLLHRDGHNADIEAILEVLHHYQVEGKIRHYGVSNWTLDRVKKFNELARIKGYDPIFCVSNASSLIPWEKDPWGGGDGCVCSTGRREEFEYYASTGTMFLAYSPLARGFLSGKLLSSDPSTYSSIDKWSKKAYFSPKNLAKLGQIEKIAQRLNLSVPSLTLAYLGNLPGQVIPSVGSGSASRIESNLNATKTVLDEATMNELDEIAKP